MSSTSGHADYLGTIVHSLVVFGAVCDVMRFPIKLNRAYWPRAGAFGVPSTWDPRDICANVDSATFSRALSKIKFGTTFKTTCKARFPLSIAALSKGDSGASSVILDVGASDGTASLDVIRALDFDRYYVTDLNIDVFVTTSGGVTWFYDAKGRCILAVTDKWIIYNDCEGAIFPFGLMASRLIARAPGFSNHMRRVVLISPELLSCKSDVRVERYDVMDDWQLEKADIVIAANILNRAYFADSSISLALRHLRDAMKPGGRLAIIDNRPDERSSIFRSVDGMLVVEDRINGGSDIESLALGLSR